MARKGYTPEQIIRKLRETEVLIAEGMTAVEAARRIGVTEQTYYRWRKEYGGSYDFVHARTRDGRDLRMLTILDEYTRECLAIIVARKLTHDEVMHRLTDLFFRRGVPEHIRSDNGTEFTAKAVRTWLSRLGVKTLHIEPGSPW